MPRLARLSLGVGSTVFWAAVAFALVLSGEWLWAPVDYVHPATTQFWPAGAGIRLMIYLIVSFCQVVTWSALTERRANTAMVSALLGTAAWVFWLLAQPSALFSVINEHAAVRFANAVRHVSVIGEIYNAWGFPKYIPLLVLLHAGITLALLVLVTRAGKPTLDAAPVASDGTERNGPRSPIV